MARHHKYDLLQRILESIADAGWNILYLASIDEHPFRLQIFREGESYPIRIYIWHITHGGGRARPQDEYRIQITGIDAFEQLPGEKTVVLGWWPESEVFAGFDVRKHLGRLGRSPSIQIRGEFLRKAYLNGFAAYDKGNQEIAIAFRPDFFVEYVRSLESLHDFGESRQDLEILDSVAQQPEVNVADIPIIDRKRRETVAIVSRKLRDVNFRKRVLTAYSFRCAMCGLQLKLVDAAHIIPVSYEGSTDETNNGLTLCALHHRAYDLALVTVWDDYSVRMNQKQLSELRRINQIGGLDMFSQNLRPLVLLPPAVTDRPHLENIQTANRIRAWDGT